ncbi:MAG: hypothetical protein ACI4IJ_01565 [Acutalibacteraceae bacterium]
MINLIKMDFFRLFKARNTYITLLFVVAFSLILFGMSSAFGSESMAKSEDGGENIMYSEITEQETQEIKSGNGGVGFVLSEFTADTPIKLDALLAGFLSSGFFLIFSGIFITNMVCDRYKCGFQKNLNIYAKKKWQIVVSENISMFIFAAVEIILAVAAISICSVFYFNNFSVGNLSSLIRYLGMQILMHYAFATLIMCFAELLRGKIVCITLTCLLSMGIGGVIMNKLDSIFEFENFSFAKSAIDYHIKLMPLKFDGELWGQAIAVVIFSIIVYNAVSALIVSKRDLA